MPGTGAAILRGDGTGSVVTIEPGAMPDTVLDTLRIEQGRSENTGGGVLAEMAWPTLSRLTLTDNAADQGGAVGIVFGGAVLTDLVVSGNTAETFGGGIFVKDASVTLSSSRFSGNTTSNSGAGIAVYRSRFLLDSILCYENTAETNGGAVYILESTGSLVNATLADNAAAFGGGGLYTRSSTMNVANCIVASNGTGLVNSSGNVSTQNCILFGNAVANQIDVRLDSATFFTDPLFVDQGNRDYHLQSQSPAINRGLTSLARGSFDLDGNPRVLGIAVDIGAYEAAGPLPLDEVRLALRICAGLAAGTPAELTRLDRTQDGVVTLRDAAHLARSLAR